MSSPDATGRGASPAYARWALGVLFCVYAVNLLDRQILAILLEPIKRELGVSDKALGFLTGFAFALFYSTAGIPIARWADRGSRVNVISIGLVLWSSATAACGLARSFVQLAAARVAVGVGEAAGTPPAHSLISDYFPPQRRATALSVYNMGASLGILLGLFAGGWLSDTYGWRATFFAVGLPGVGMALVVRLGLREPPRGLSEGRPDEGGQPPLGEALRRLAGLRTYRHICLATALYNFASYGFLAWAATFLIRVHGLSATQVGMTLGPIAGIAGAAGALLGGLLGDWGARRDARWQMWVPAIGGFATAPFLILFLTLDNPYWALASYVPAALFGGFWGGPTYAVTQGLVGLRLRTMASAVLLFVLNFIGMGFGPLLVGILSDALQPAYGAHALGYALLIVGLSKVWGAVHSLLGASSVRAELAAARAEAAHPRGSGFA